MLAEAARTYGHRPATEDRARPSTSERSDTHTDRRDHRPRRRTDPRGRANRPRCRGHRILARRGDEYLHGRPALRRPPRNRNGGRRGLGRSGYPCLDSPPARANRSTPATSGTTAPGEPLVGHRATPLRALREQLPGHLARDRTRGHSGGTSAAGPETRRAGPSARRPQRTSTPTSRSAARSRLHRRHRTGNRRVHPLKEIRSRLVARPLRQWRAGRRPAARSPRNAYARFAPSGCMNAVARTSRYARARGLSLR